LAKITAKRAQGKPLFGGFPWLWVTIAAFIAVFAFGFTSQRSQVITPPIPEGTRAAIIDQLYASYPNEDFTARVTENLEGFGFGVDVYQGADITVDFCRNLPAFDYKLIVFRAHSGAIGSNPQDVESMIGTYLFTNEAYTEIKYPREQLNDELAKARVAQGYPYFFAIGPKFVTHSMKGNFNTTVIIIAGCSCLYNQDLAQAFTQKGASAYLAWDATVDLDYVDEATMTLIENLCSERLPVNKAVDFTMARVGPDPKHGAVLQYYPPQTGDKTLRQLINP